MAFYNKPTKAEITAKIGKLQQARSKMETREPTRRVLDSWARFKLLPISEKNRLRNEWDIYYKNVQESTIYALFQEQNKAFKERNFARVKELAKQAKEMRLNNDHITLKQPDHIDPWEFDNGSIVSAYKKINRELDILSESDREDSSNAEENLAFL